MLRDCADTFKLIEACMGEAREKMRDVEPLHARIAELEAALTKAATRLKEVHSKGRASRSQYKIYAEEAFAALKGEK